MTTDLRDYFAAKALQGILSSPAEFTCEGKKIGYAESKVAKLAYVFADAMIEARKLTPNKDS